MESIEILIRCLKVTYLVLELYLEIGIGVFFLLDEMLKLRRINHYLHLGLKLLFLKELRILLLRLLFNRLWLALRQFLRRYNRNEFLGDLDVPSPGGSGSNQMDVLFR